MKDIEKATTLLSGNSLVLVKGEEVIIFDERGILPLVRLAASEKDYSLFSVADKIVGKAAALLYCLLGICNLKAGIITKKAIEILSRKGVSLVYDECVEHIINRKGTGLCPMENLVKDIDSPKEALIAIQDYFNRPL